jgi:hypothetical protein
MIRYFILVLCSFFLNNHNVLAQHFYTEKINEKSYKVLALKIDREITQYKNQLTSSDLYTSEMIQFMLDTFKIEAINRERQTIEDCTNCIIIF